MVKKYKVKGKNLKNILQKIAVKFEVEEKEIAFDVVKEEKSIMGKVKEVEIQFWIKSKNSDKKTTVKKEVDDKIFDYIDITVDPEGVFLKVKKSFLNSGIPEIRVSEEIIKREIKSPDVFMIKSCLDENINKMIQANCCLLFIVL